jgi:phage/plasmid-like protein (TIGR03299 family)
LGTAVEKEVTSTAALKLAGLDWQVEKRPIYADNGIGEPSIPVTSHEAVFRTEDNRFLGVVGKGYELIQNEDAFAFLDALVGEGLAMFHTAGSIFGGRRVFISCKMPSSIQVGPDQVDKYLTLCTGHDGSMAMHVKWTPIRVVCWNTMSAAFNIYGGKVHATDCVTIRHTKNYKEKIDEARRLLNLTEVYYKRLDECFQRLIETPMSNIEFVNFSKKMYPDEKKEDTDKILDRKKQREDLMHLFSNGIGNNAKGVKCTRWAALNAVTEYIDHEKKYWEGKNSTVSDSRMNSIVWGAGSSVKKRALELLQA